MANRRPSEIPPTAGLPPRWRDLFPSAGDDLATHAARLLGVESVQVECSGTACLVIALTALHRLSGRRVVVVPAYTCPLVAIAVAHCGLEIRLCDLASDSIDVDSDRLKEACDSDVLAVLPTHLAGRVADVDPVLSIARAVGAYVIEDAAQAFGARRGGRSVGLDGDAGFFSLAVGKGLTTYEGGLLVARDATVREAFATVSRELAPPRIGWELRRSLELIGYHLFYRPSLLPLAYGVPLRRALRRDDPVDAVGDDFSNEIPLHSLGAWRRSVAARAIARWPAFQEECALQAARRRIRLAKIEGLHVIDDHGDARGVWPFLLVMMRDRQARDATLATLWGRGVGISRLFIHALPEYAYLRSSVGEQPVPNARAFAGRTLTISNSPWLDDATFERICEVLETS
ncbi:MAG: DegT/DnrJ/EryC1/StrS family aminotransferase [Dokdonella sp.]|uniref:DegT/DnrJ/EryC1/StrS family aminotransferase n=1 Tax=Dokdonella sp. TaxID=2291710 RepID=UPI003265B6A8